MEELRSTEILDKEILNESKKRGDKLIQRARETALKVMEDVDLRLNDAEKEARCAAEKNLSLYKNNVDAALPLEKQRILVSFIHNSIIDALNEYFDNLDDSKQIEILTKHGKNYSHILKEKTVETLSVKSLNVSEKTAQSLTKEIFGRTPDSVTVITPQQVADEKVKGLKLTKGIIAEAFVKNDSEKNERVIFTVTFDEIVKELLSSNTQELAQALFTENDGGLF